MIICKNKKLITRFRNCSSLLAGIFVFFFIHSLFTILYSSKKAYLLFFVSIKEVHKSFTLLLRSFLHDLDL